MPEKKAEAKSERATTASELEGSGSMQMQMVHRKIRNQSLRVVAMRFLNVRRTIHQSHEMHGNKPSTQRGLGSLNHVHNT
jgi:hypothetical protein